MIADNEAIGESVFDESHMYIFTPFGVLEFIHWPAQEVDELVLESILNSLTPAP